MPLRVDGVFMITRESTRRVYVPREFRDNVRATQAVETQELYGYISMATREWKDGLLSTVMRNIGAIPDELPKWIMLDGDLVRDSA